MPFARMRFAFRKQGSTYWVKVKHRPSPDDSHIPSLTEIEVEIQRLVDALIQAKLAPRIITVCRSRHSGYCPNGLWADIPERLVPMLRAAF